MRSLPIFLAALVACGTPDLGTVDHPLATLSATSGDAATLPADLVAAPGDLLLAQVDPFVAGTTARVAVLGADPNARITIHVSPFVRGPQICPPNISPTCLDIRGTDIRLATQRADANGVVVFDIAVPATVEPLNFQMQASSPGNAVGDADTSNVISSEIEPSVFRLTVLHSNDGESELLGDGDFGRADRFVAKFHELQADADARVGLGEAGGPLSVTSGDNFLSGPEFEVSLLNGRPFYDALALQAVGFDALCLGNHDFDLTPDVLFDFIGSFDSNVTFLSANLDFSGEPSFDDLVDSGRVAASKVVEIDGRRVGVVGATTPALPFISSPRNVAVNPVAPAVQGEINALEADGVNIIVLISHLQSIEEDLALISTIEGVDIAVAGGGDELLANASTLLVDGDDPGDIYGPYPTDATSADGATVPVVTTNGGYFYIGQLVAEFDRDGNLLMVGTESDAIRVVDVAAQTDGVTGDVSVFDSVVTPVTNGVAALDSILVGLSDVDLDGQRASVRGMETNQGNLIADSFLYQATLSAAAEGNPLPDVALANGGGIRNSAILPAGDITLLDTYDMLPFLNYISVVPSIPRAQFKEIMENAISRIEFGDGRFAQVAGFSVIYDTAATGQILDDSFVVTTPGSRVVDITLDDGTQIVANGTVVPGAPINIAIVDFLANGGDQYPFRSAAFDIYPVTYQKALENYIIDFLGGLVLATDYPAGGEGRITDIAAVP